MVVSSGVKKPERHSQHYIETLVFQVDDTLFRVPSRYLLEHSEILKAASEISATSSEGLSDAHPIKLPLPDDGDAEDFANFAQVVYPLTVKLPVPSDFSREQWISVLKLSTCWMLDNLREIAISNVARGLSLVDKVRLGRKYKVTAWVLEGLRELANPSTTLLPLSELQSLGLDTAVRLLYARNSPRPKCSKTQDEVRRNPRLVQYGAPYCHCGDNSSMHPTQLPAPVVEQLFSDEFSLLLSK
ncbi:hypothetical protein V5O48_002400 [Marasmius crinis-equi]|uniref:BTB domain-containing protein n=1 Tax=Marasmius crinis-equi TaxID=585013 RepID=A0ABR3FW66_9AGAR